VRWPEVACPAISTVHAVLDRHGLVSGRRRRRRPRLTGTRLTQPSTPNALWCADYKGEFLLGNGRYCYRGLEELEYPGHDWTAVITTCGRICYQRRKINVSQVFAGQKVGVKQV
jgi:hypothetical protein